VLVVPTYLNVFCRHHVYNITFPSVSLHLRSVPYTQYFSRDKIEKNEMGGACSTYVGGERRMQCFVGET